jgi:hypothetical protein
MLKDEDADGLPDAEKAVSLAPPAANCFGTRGAIREKPGQRDDAIADFHMALSPGPHHQMAEDGLRRPNATP